MLNIMFIGNGFDIQHNILIRFYDFVTSKIFKDGVGKTYYKYFTAEKYNEYLIFTNQKIKFNKNSLWSQFEEYLKYIVEKECSISSNHFTKKITKIFQKWFTSLNIVLPEKKDKIIEEILRIHEINFIISLNYTRTPEKYGFKKLTFKIDSSKSEWTKFEIMNKKYITIHSYDKNYRQIYYILGHDENLKIGKNNYIKEWSQKNNFNPKELLLKHILKSDKILKIIVYGYSFGKSDKYINDFLKQFSKNRNVIVYFKENQEIKNLSLDLFLNKDLK